MENFKCHYIKTIFCDLSTSRTTSQLSHHLITTFNFFIKTKAFLEIKKSQVKVYMRCLSMLVPKKRFFEGSNYLFYPPGYSLHPVCDVAKASLL